MGIMDTIVNKAGRSPIPGGDPSPVLGTAIQLLSSVGGIEGLVHKFQAQGLGRIARSWVGTGPNLPLEDNQLHQVMGHEPLNSAAHEVGMPVGDLTHQLSGLLPKLVNEMTPDGRVPQEMPDTQDLVSMGLRLLGK